MKLPFPFSLSMIVMIIIGGNAFASQLDSFERGATTPKQSSSSDRKEESATHSPSLGCKSNCLMDGVFELMIDAAAAAAIAGGEMSNERTMGEQQGYGVSERNPGELLIPLFRSDLAIQQLEQHLFAVDLRMEAGYGAFGIEGRFTEYRESTPSDHMSISRLHLLYRMSFGDHFGMNFAAGRAYLGGNGQYSGSSWGLPIYFHPSKYWGVEWKPIFMKFNGVTNSDQDLSLHLNYQFGSLMLGYRRISNEVSDLSGPYVGISLHY